MFAPKNGSLMLPRRQRRLREVFFDSTETDNEDGAPVMQIPDLSLDPKERYSQQEREQILSVAMDELAPGQRAAIELSELDGHSVKETARNHGRFTGGGQISHVSCAKEAP